MSRDFALESAVTGDRQGRDITNRARTDLIRARLEGITPYPWRVVDARHQQGGQVRVFGASGTGALIANVLRSGPHPDNDSKIIGGAPAFLEHLLAELDRVDVNGAAGVRLAAAVLHAAGPADDRHAPIYVPDTCHICASAAGLVNTARTRYGTFTEE